MRILITGDRSMHPIFAANVVGAVINVLVREHHDLHGHDFCAGDLMGVERAVHYLLPTARLFRYGETDEGKPDFDGTYSILAGDVDRVVVLHSDPLVSSVAKAVMRNFPEDKVWLPVPEPATFDV